MFEMDSDLSHDPADLARLLGAVRDDGADVALGSRYVPGGGVSDWGHIREAISRSGSWYSRRVLGLELRDLTGGFKCFRAEVLRTIDLARVRSRGYAFQVELTYRAIVRGYRVVEVPIVFRDRALGTSKMSWRITLEAAQLVPQLRKGARHLVDGSGRTQGPPRRADLNEVNASRLAFVEGMDVTRSTLRRWNAAPMSLPSTKASRLAFTSVRSARRARALSPAGPIGEVLGAPPQLRNEPCGLHRDVPRHLRLPVHSVAEDDRHLGDRKPRRIAR